MGDVVSIGVKKKGISDFIVNMVDASELKANVDYKVDSGKMPKIKNITFFKLKDVVDADLATELGLGVVTCENEKMVYIPFLDGNPTKEIYGMLMLKIYNQLRHPYNVDELMKKNFWKYESLIASFIKVDAPKHIAKLKEIFT